MSDRDRQVDEFRADLDALIEKHWSVVGPSAWTEEMETDDDPNAANLVAWVVVVEGRTMEPDSSSFTSHYTRRHQSVIHTLGLLTEQAAIIAG